MCSWTQIAGQETRLVRVETHKKLKVSKGGQIKSEQVPTRAFYRGLQVCGLRWVCPCCTIKKSEGCRAEMNAALAEARKRGLQPVMLTLTARHKRSMPLAEIQGKIASAEKRLKTTRHWKRLMKVATGGFAKAVEVTHGANGWHPHFHIILLLDCDSQPEAFEEVEELREAWLHELTCAGLDGTSKKAVEHSFDYCGAEEAGEYVSKWGAGEEMTLAGSKVGRGKGRTPWQLLRDARVAETDAERMKAGALWWEFIQVMKGVHQLRQSPAFRQLVKEYEPPKVPEQPDPVETEVFSFGRKGDDGLWLFARHRRSRMQDKAEEGTVEDARQGVQEVMLDERTDEYLRKGDIPDPGPLIEHGE
ncbi:plasmid replication protein RepW (plasmid) [Sulfitobacter sp. DSM 110093]|uniref:protein rep n=1 Tax=Sulfitobacter sp. DSM 110093 TaxID=2883127 RepID=UPI001FAE6D89|nr:protein rep [Sulfitobacter sp. DSM 110093]UOA34412.1 plasmid replication protein RepW [Sulfitobacter sp. DSM 110093]